jgi:hypothetical protein
MSNNDRSDHEIDERMWRYESRDRKRSSPRSFSIESETAWPTSGRAEKRMQIAARIDKMQQDLPILRQGARRPSARSLGRPRGDDRTAAGLLAAGAHGEREIAEERRW